MSGNTEITLELQDVCRKLQEKKSEIEVGMDNLEKGKIARDVQKKEILLREMKQVLTILNDTDTKIVKDLKGEALDLIRMISKIGQAASALKDLVNNGTQDDAKWKDDVEALKDKVQNLRLDEFLSSLDMSVSIQPGSMATAFEKISDSIFFQTPVLHPKLFLLELPERLPSFQAANCNPKFVDVQIFTVGEGHTFTPMVLTKLMLDLTYYQMPGQGRVVMEETSVWTKMEKNKAWLSEDGGLVTVQVKRPNNIIGKISVRVLGSNIVNSPLLHQFLSDDSRDPTSDNKAFANDSIGIFDSTGLDEFDLASLDMTTRRQMPLSAGKQEFLDNPTFHSCQSPRRVSRQRNISSVLEVASLDQKVQDILGSHIVNSPILHQLYHGYSGINVGGLKHAADKISKELINTSVSDAPDHDQLSQYITSTFSPHSKEALIKARRAAAIQLDGDLFRVFEDGS